MHIALVIFHQLSATFMAMNMFQNTYSQFKKYQEGHFGGQKNFLGLQAAYSQHGRLVKSDSKRMRPPFKTIMRTEIDR